MIFRLAGQIDKRDDIRILDKETWEKLKNHSIVFQIVHYIVLNAKWDSRLKKNCLLC